MTTIERIDAIIRELTALRDELVPKPEGRPAIEWLKDLPDGWRQAALRYAKGKKTKAGPLRIVTSKAHAVMSAFAWSCTNEGDIRWHNLWCALRDGNPLPPFPTKRKARRKK